MRRKVFCLLLALCASLQFAACAPPESVDPRPDPPAADTHETNAPAGAKEALFDRSFRYGLEVFGVNSSNAALPWATLYPQSGERELDPYWRIEQWAFYVNYFLEKELVAVEPTGTVTYPRSWQEPVRADDWVTIANAASTVAVSDTGAFRLVADASKEYGVTPSYAEAPKIPNPRRAGDDWPHLLFEQYIPSVTRLGDLAEAWFDIDFQVLEAVNLTPAYDPGLHTAQFSWIFTVSCDNRGKASYGKGYFFTIPLYDFRYRIIPASFMVDGGKESATGNMMYGLTNEALVPGGVEVGKKYSVSVDLYPQLAASFARMQQDGFFPDCTLADMRLNTTNIGWELPGTFRAGVQVDYLSLKYVEKEA